MCLTGRRALLLPASPLAALAACGTPLGLDELERLDVEQALLATDDVGLAERLEELLRTVEVAHPDLHRAEALGHVAVGARAGDDPVLGGEAGRLLVECREGHARIEDLDRVDVLDHVE